MLQPAHDATLVDDFTSEHHVYEPYKAGLPPLRPYLRELWKRREFAFELSRTRMRAQHFDTVFGKLWLLLNPILLTFVYFMLVDILRGGSQGSEFFAHLMAGLFAFQVIQVSVRQGVRAVTSGGRLILNTAFPRLLLPLSSAITAVRRFLPSLVIYAIVHVVVGAPIGWELLLALPIMGLLFCFAAGVAVLVSAVQVYFRDLSQFVPYALRIWLYSTPILYYASEVPTRYDWILAINPAAPFIRCWSQVLDEGKVPDLYLVVMAVAWATVLLVGSSLFFISRERELAVRL
ncbi:MAG: teichoic acid transport system permease protein [Thermoleophilaceae bacterium]|jgi:teichoic acid transport system permease protein|nr:teichoic acid transport system permease protein [Thermoleophilaceae bacterium]